MEHVTPEASFPARPEQGPTVTITVDNQQYSLHRGHILVSDLKAAVGVPATKDLDQVVAGELKPLQDTDKLVLKGGEVFITHERTGGSS